MAYYTKANHVSGQIIISAVNEDIGYDSVRATIALDCDTAISQRTSENILHLIADNGIEYSLYFPNTRVFNNDVEQAVANLSALDAWASGHKSTACSAGGGGGGTELVGDTSPQLGGTFDTNNYGASSPADYEHTLGAGDTTFTLRQNDATAVFQAGTSGGARFAYVNGTFTVAGDITLSGTVDTRDVNADGTKLDNLATLIGAPTGTTLADLATGATGDKFLVIDDTDGTLKGFDFNDLPSGGGGTPAELTDLIALLSAPSGSTLGTISTGAVDDIILMIDDTDGTLKGYSLSALRNDMPEATTGAKGWMSATDKTKLDASTPVNTTGLAAGEMVFFDGTEFKKDPSETADAQTTFTLGFVGSQYTGCTAAAYTITATDLVARQSAIALITNASEPSFTLSGGTVTKVGWGSRWDDTNQNHVTLVAFSPTLVYAYLGGSES